MRAVKKWFSFAEIVKDDVTKMYHHNVTHTGKMSDWQDPDKFLLEDEFLTYDDAFNDLMNQGYMWDSDITMFVLVLDHDEVKVVETRPWDTIRNKELEAIFRG